MKASIIILLAAMCAITTRTYWMIDATEFATVGSPHTHVSVSGWVTYVRCEDDGDVHLRIVPAQGTTAPSFIAECIPSMPCTRPAIGAHIKVNGISRRDPEHQWWEIHPVETIEPVP